MAAAEKKACRKCHSLKPLTEFYGRADTRRGIRNDCKRCDIDQQSVRQRRPEIATRLREYRRAYYHRPHVKERQRAYAERYRQTPDFKARHRANMQRAKVKRYALTVEQYRVLSANQGDVCAICRLPETRMEHGVLALLSIDHDHVTGRVRGLLCGRCNRAIGMLRDDPDLITAAAVYLGAAKEVHDGGG